MCFGAAGRGDGAFMRARTYFEPGCAGSVGSRLGFLRARLRESAPNCVLCREVKVGGSSPPPSEINLWFMSPFGMQAPPPFPSSRKPVSGFVSAPRPSSRREGKGPKEKDVVR